MDIDMRVGRVGLSLGRTISTHFIRLSKKRFETFHKQLIYFKLLFCEEIRVRGTPIEYNV